MQEGFPTLSSGRSLRNVRAILWVALFAYFVIFTGFPLRDPSTAERVTSSVLAAVLCGLYLLRAPGQADRIDRNLLIAAVLFLIPCVLSRFPRESLHSSLTIFVLLAGLFTAREVLSHDSARRLFLAGMMVLSALLTVVFAAQVLIPYVEWWARTGWRVLPPLDLKSLPQPWTLRYEPLILLLLLYPAWWVGRASSLRVAAGIAVGALLAAATLVVGSRNIWLAVLVGLIAVALLGVLRRTWRASRIVERPVVLLAVAGGLLVAAVIGGSALERAIRVAPLTERAATWSSALSAWLDRPIFGQGPGSFPWLLQLTGYFDTNSYAPHQPDSSYVQLLAGAGIVGVIAFLLAAYTLAPAIWKGRARGAVFAIAVVITAGIGLGPTEFMPILVVGVGWIALARPRSSDAAPALAMPRASRVVRFTTVVAATIVGLAYGATVVGAVDYSNAVQAIYAGDTVRADSLLSEAAILDPGLAIYPRQLGTVRLLANDLRGASDALHKAVATNPRDDLAWRELGIVLFQQGDSADSIRSLERAVAIQRSDPSNLLLYARTLLAVGDESSAKAILSEVVQAWPLIVADPTWGEFIRPFDTQELLGAAWDRWQSGATSPEPLNLQPLLLAIMTDENGSRVRSAESRLSGGLRDAFISATRCDDTAEDSLASLPASEVRQETYWALVLRMAAENHQGGVGQYLRIHQLMTGDNLYAGLSEELNPLSASGLRGSNNDVAGYRRTAVVWQPTPWDLPSPWVGQALWYRQPGPSARTSGLAALARQCH